VKRRLDTRLAAAGSSPGRCTRVRAGRGIAAGLVAAAGLLAYVQTGSEQVVQPTRRRRHGVLRQEDHVRASSLAREQVARPPVREIARSDPQHARTARGCDRDRAVARAGVAHEQLDAARRPLPAHGVEHALQPRSAVADRDGDRDVHQL